MHQLSELPERPLQQKRQKNEQNAPRPMAMEMPRKKKK
jgi:hypothetical protein